MEPSVLEGDFFFVVPRHGIALQHDQLVTYRWNSTTILKRVVGLQGDTLQMRAGELYRDGNAVSEPYARTDKQEQPEAAPNEFDWQRTALVPMTDTAQYQPTVDSWGPIVVTSGHVFLLGDNRHDSFDSRYIGFVSTDSVIGRPTYVYVSRSDSGGTKWRRIGQRLQ
jgi:signal peptidase I